MQKKVCDRCKSEIVEQPSFMNVSFPLILAKVVVKKSLIGEFTDYDLCEKCKAKLVKWIEEANENAGHS